MLSLKILSDGCVLGQSSGERDNFSPQNETQDSEYMNGLCKNIKLQYNMYHITIYKMYYNVPNTKI